MAVMILGAIVGEAMEKDINLAVALLVQEQLSEQEGVTVLMTRNQDVFLTLTDRQNWPTRKTRTYT